MTPSAILPASIPDSQLGLDASEIRLLRQHQQIALSGVGGGRSVASGGMLEVFSLKSYLSLRASHCHPLSRNSSLANLSPKFLFGLSTERVLTFSNLFLMKAPPTSRGRGHARASATTSRAASSAASSAAAGGGRLVLDAGSLTVLGQHFERLMGAIQTRVETVSGLLFGVVHLFFHAWTHGLPTMGDEQIADALNGKFCYGMDIIFGCISFHVEYIASFFCFGKNCILPSLPFSIPLLPPNFIIYFFSRPHLFPIFSQPTLSSLYSPPSLKQAKSNQTQPEIQKMRKR